MSRLRICNSEDGPDVAEQGLCIANQNDYNKVRVYSHNWESAIAISWIMQIIYSELVGVPSTIESGVADKIVNFYDETNRMDYGSGNDYSVIQNTHIVEGGNCTLYKERGGGGNAHTPCAHVAMEIWSSTTWKRAVSSGAAKALNPVGIIGFQGWHITDFSLKKDPSLEGHHGLSGENN